MTDETITIPISFPEGNSPYPLKGDREDQLDHTGFAAFNIAQNVYDVLKQDPARGFQKAKTEMLVSYKVENDYPANLPKDAPTVDNLLDQINSEKELAEFIKIGQRISAGPQKKFLIYPTWNNKPIFSLRRAGGF